METKLALFYFGAFIALLLVVGIYGVYKKSLNSKGRLTKSEFQEGLTIFLKVVFGVVLFALIISVIPAVLYYDGTCSEDFVFYTPRRIECSFWQFYVRGWLQAIFTGIPPQF